MPQIIGTKRQRLARRFYLFMVVFSSLFFYSHFFPVSLHARSPYFFHDSVNSINRFHSAALTEEVDSIVVVKKYRHMFVFNNRRLLKVYHISLGEAPVGAKHFKDDRKTPEGLYYIDCKNPKSMAHKSLGVSYPNNEDRKYARKFGRETGGDIKIHGIVNGYEKQTADWMKADWTWGCIAVTNPEMDELFEHVKMGAPINILP